MGSSALSEAVKSIRDWSQNEGRVSTSSPTKAADTFGSLVFGDKVQQARLPKAAYQALRATITRGEPLALSTADAVAKALMEWAIEHGATHYTHWFQPMTGITAEKHDSFLGPAGDGTAIAEFRGKELIKGEPDASSFPSGGMRSTFEARGYTAWDPTSPPWLLNNGNCGTLVIPTAFVSWTGEALDKKTPLLRSMEAVSKQAVRMLRIFGSKTERVFATCGPEQEYFLIDRNFYFARPDLINAGRTLFGAKPPKGQEMEDQYFGHIPARVLACMSEVEAELYRVGVPVKTRHNEVAPSQYEIAPVFENANVAADHQMMTMETLQRVAPKFGLACLLHEKPFAGVNGSGKHNNWSLCTSEGVNLLDPGETPHENLTFLTTLAVVLHAVHEHADMLRVTIASAGNDHRLGANEAPPAILSVYLGEALEAIVHAIESGKAPNAASREAIALTKRLRAKPDLTDRNRTTPFAFTGNKFEFRAVGSSENPAWPMAVLNAAVASSCREIRGRIEARMKASGDRVAAVRDVVRETFASTKAIRFEGNNYSPEWAEEARRRGLPVLSNTPAALAVLQDSSRTNFLTEMSVFTHDEIHSRYEVYAERYIKVVDIEASSLADIALTHVLPVLERQVTHTLNAQRALKDVGAAHEHQSRRARTLCELTEELQITAEKLSKARRLLHDQSSVAKGMDVAANQAIPAMFALRAVVDAAEGLVSDASWPLPKYREMLFAGV